MKTSSPMFSPEMLGGDDAERVLRWYVIHKMPKSLRYAARCLGASDVSDIVHDVYLQILTGKPIRDGFALSTIVCNAARWTLLRVGAKSRQMVHNAKLRPCEELKDIFVSYDERDTLERVCLAETRDTIHSVLITLPYRLRIVVEMRYGLGDGHQYTLSQVGRILKISGDRVRQIEQRAIRLLQHPHRSARLRNLLTLAGDA